MSHSNGIITDPVSLSADIYPVLGINKTGEFYDTVYACANTHGRINMWSRFKPVRWTNRPGITSQNPEWWKGEDGRCGIKLPSGVSSYKNIPALMTEDKMNGWEYMPPTGGAFFCAVDFFSNYKHDARSIIYNFTVTEVVSQDEYLTASCVLGITEAPDADGGKTGPGAIALDDLRGDVISGEDALTLADYYLGIVILDGSGNVMGRVAGGQGANHHMTKYKVSGLKLGSSYKAYPFLAKYEMEQSEADKMNSYITLPNTSFAEFRVGTQEEMDGIHITLTARYLYLNGTTKTGISYTLNITTDAKSYDFSNNYIMMRFSTSGENDTLLAGEQRVALDDPIRLTATTPYKKNGTFSIGSAYAGRNFYIYLTLDTARYTKKIVPVAST